MVKYEHLLGFQFTHGVRDCYELARDFYRDNFEIELPAVARPDDWWWQGMDLYRDYLSQTGFEIVDIPVHEIRPADACLICVRSEVPNHCAMFLDQNQILHHPFGRFSLVDQYKGLWRNNTSCVIRHRDVPDLRQANAQVLDLMSQIPQYFKEKINERAPELLQPDGSRESGVHPN